MVYFYSAAVHVAPRAGAWIETLELRMDRLDIPSHPVRVRGLKHIKQLQAFARLSRTPCGCVD